MMDELVLVTQTGHPIGTCSKIYAHRHGLLHRAFSIFIQKRHNNQTFILLQKRHPLKYHSGNLWTNTCCSHPRPDEEVGEAASRRLLQEVGLTVELEYRGHFIYRHQFSNGLIEHEYDHVWVGHYDGEVQSYNTQEIAEVRWVSLEQIAQELTHSAQQFTPWFGQALSIAYPNVIPSESAWR
jgi:isopentenyl-diphosphate delta-isomerase type 1